VTFRESFVVHAFASGFLIVIFHFFICLVTFCFVFGICVAIHLFCGINIAFANQLLLARVLSISKSCLHFVCDCILTKSALLVLMFRVSCFDVPGWHDLNEPLVLSCCRFPCSLTKMPLRRIRMSKLAVSRSPLTAKNSSRLDPCVTFES